MDKEFGFQVGNLRIFMKENMKMIWSMDLVYTSGPMDPVMKDISRPTENMAKGL